MIHVQPSWFVRQTRVYKFWCNITVCPKCGLRAKYEDCHPVNPCPNCGSKLVERVGKFVPDPKHWWEFWKRSRGAWKLLEE